MDTQHPSPYSRVFEYFNIFLAEIPLQQMRRICFSGWDECH
ncbi:hypothetical protein [Helicobacter bizzozeronii]|nr:hypothetical protein [Helicobacter bizzozeronii]